MIDVADYHNRTKHSYNQYARSSGFLDWETQPVPFRFYDDCRQIALPYGTEQGATEYKNLYLRKNEVKDFSLESISDFFKYSLALAAWKSTPGMRWSLRCAPSSGALYPTEAHILTDGINGIEPGVFHYSPLKHALENRASLNLDAALLAEHFGCEGFLVSLSSIFWRESWKYGERAFRYCNHDVGHAAACLSFSANLLGWKVSYLNEVLDDQISVLMGLDAIECDKLEKEEVDLLCYIHTGTTSTKNVPSSLLTVCSDSFSQTSPNELSSEKVDWEVIYDVAETTEKKSFITEPKNNFSTEPFQWLHTPEVNIEDVILTRRSAQEFFPNQFMDKEIFFTMLDKTIAREGSAPFDMGLTSQRINLLLFVHTVNGLESGLYMFMRNEQLLAELKLSMDDTFVWERVSEAVPLYLLKVGDCRQVATRMSCTQDIAGDSVFSLGMIAPFEQEISKSNHNYRNLFWEAGQIGQVLYMEAEAHGFRGTGIGCYFDDPIHGLMGLKDMKFQSMYHFTIGVPMTDDRISTNPPYPAPSL